MFKALILFLTFISFNAFTSETRTIDMNNMSSQAVEDACRLEAEDYGDLILGSEKKKTIHPECRKFVESIATHDQKAQSKDGKVRVMAAINIVYIDIDVTINDKPVTLNHIISGRMSKLTNIKSIALSNDRSKLAILNERKTHQVINKEKETDMQYTMERELFIFNATLSGNVSPSREIIAKEINSANEMSFHPSDNELYLINTISNHVVSFNPNADKMFKSGNLQPKVIRSFSPSDETFRVPASIDFMDNSLLILDSTTNKVIALDPSSNATIWEMSNEDIGLDTVAHLRYDKSQKKLIISDDQGNTVSFDQN